MVNELIPMTYDEIKQLRGMARYNAIEVHKAWLARQRKQDKKELRNITYKIFITWWRKNDPEGYKKDIYIRNKKYFERVKANPEKYAELLKKNRKESKIRYRQLKKDPKKYHALLKYCREHAQLRSAYKKLGGGGINEKEKV